LNIDRAAVGLSGAEAAAADLISYELVFGGLIIAGPGGGAGAVPLALGADAAIAIGSPLAFPENALGIASFVATSVSDIFAGYSGPTESGIVIGQDTIVAARNMVAGVLPESNWDLAVSVSQLKYDLDRRNGTKEGGSIELSRKREDLARLIFLGQWW